MSLAAKGELYVAEMKIEFLERDEFSPEGCLPFALADGVHQGEGAQHATTLAQDGGHHWRRPVAVGVLELGETRPVVLPWGAGQRAFLAKEELSENIISFNLNRNVHVNKS